jgi:predicted transcriptional regulator
MSSGSEERKRVQFRAPRSLVDRADVLAAVLETDRTDVIISALREYLRDAAHDDELKQEIADAYYDGDITFEELKNLVGHEEAANFRVLKTQLSEDFLDDATEEFADS